MDFSVYDNENVKNHMAMLDAAYASGAPAGVIGHIENQLNQAMLDAASSSLIGVPRGRLAPTLTSSGDSGGGGGGGPAPAPPPLPAPPPPPTTFSVKQPAPSLVQYDAQALPQELIEDLLYEQVGGQELVNIARHDTINGQDVSYSLVRNLSIFNQQFNPNNILAGQVAYTLQLGQYAIDIAMNVSSNQFARLDEDGNLVIELNYVGPDELIEAEISTDGTIYRLGAA